MAKLKFVLSVPGDTMYLRAQTAAAQREADRLGVELEGGWQRLRRRSYGRYIVRNFEALGFFRRAHHPPRRRHTQSRFKAQIITVVGAALFALCAKGASFRRNVDAAPLSKNVENLWTDYMVGNGNARHGYSEESW